jgi:transposase InsO family protein
MSIGKFALIEDGVLQVVRKLDRSVVINTFQSGNNFVVDLVASKSASLANDTDYDFWQAALGHPFKANVNRKLYEDGYLIRDCPSNFNCNPCALSKSNHKVPKPVESKSTEVFELIHTDVCGPFPNESYGGSKYFVTVIDDFSHFSPVFFLKQKSDTSITLPAFLNHVERQFGKKIKQIRSDNGGKYISNELKDFFLKSGVIHELTPPYSPESNGIAERCHHTINTIACCMTIAAPDFPCLWAEAVNMAAYLKNRLLHKHLPSSITPVERFHGKRPTISLLKRFGSKCYVHIREEERSSGSKHRPRAREAIIVSYTSSPKVYRVFTFEDEYVFTTRDLTFPKKTSPQVVTTLRRISQDPEPDPESTPQDQGSKDPSTTTSVHTRMLGEDFASDQDWCRYLLKYPDEAVTFYNAGHPVVHRLVPTLYEINATPPQSPQPAPQASVNSQQSFHGFADSELNAQPTVVPRHIVLPNPTSFNQTPSNGPSDRMDIDSPAHTVTRTGRVSRPPGEWWVAPTTNTDTPMPDFNNLVMEPHKEVLNTSRNILDHEKLQFYRQAISEPNADLWHSAIEAEMDVLRRNYTWDVVDRPTDRKIVDSKWVFKIKRLSDRSVDKFKARLVAKGFSQIQGQDYDETFTPVVRFDSLRLLLSIVAANGFVPLQLDVKPAFLYGELKETVYMRLPEGYRDGNKVAHLKRCIYGLKQLPREWYSRLTAYLQRHGMETSNFEACVLLHNSDQFYIAVYVDDLTLDGPPRYLMDTTVLALETEFEVMKMGQLQWHLRIQISFNRDSIELSQEAFVDKILERFRMIDSHPTLLPIDPNTRLTKEDLVLEAAQHCLYQSIIGSCMYLVTCTRPDLAYSVSYVSQFLAAPSKSHQRLPTISYSILKVPRIKNCSCLVRMHRKLLWKHSPTLTMEIVWTLGKAFPVTVFGSTIRRSVGVPRNKSLWRLLHVKLNIWLSHSLRNNGSG